MNEHELDRIAAAMNQPEWPWIPGYEGTYRISQRGEVFSVPRPTTPGGLLKWNMSDRHGYPRVTLVRHGRQKKFRVHILVARTYLGEPPAGMEVLHVNGDAGDPSLSNLRYGTHAENGQDSVRHGTCASSRKTHCPRNHEYAGANLLVSNGRRYCRTCARERGAA